MAGFCEASSASVQRVNIHMMQNITTVVQSKIILQIISLGMQGLAFCGHKEAGENLSVSCGGNLGAPVIESLAQAKLKIDSPVSSFGHGKGHPSIQNKIKTMEILSSLPLTVSLARTRMPPKNKIIVPPTKKYSF